MLHVWNLGQYMSLVLCRPVGLLVLAQWLVALLLARQW